MKNFRYYSLLCLLHLLGALPFWVLYRLSDLAQWILYKRVKYRREVVRKNLRNSFPEKTEEELTAIEREFYRHLCDVAVEAVKLMHISDRQLRDHIEVIGAEKVEALGEQGRNVVLYLSHYGNWEWAQEIVHRFSRPALKAALYRPIRDKQMDRLILRVRSRFNLHLLPDDTALRTLLRWNSRKEPFVVGFISDQRDFMGWDRHVTTFLNQETAYVTGGENIGQHVGAAFLYLRIEKTRRGHYRLTFEPLKPAADAKEYPYTISYLRHLEADINAAPAYWLWSHNRWKKWRKNPSD